MLDVVDALTQNHVALSRLADAARRANDQALRNALFDDLARALGGHFEGLECVVLPQVLDARRPGLSVAVVVGFVGLKERLALLLLARKTDEFTQSLATFCDAVEEQADLEQLELVPFLRLALTEEERFFLEPEVTSCMRRRLGEHHLDGAAPSEPPSSITEELERAALILSSLSLLRLASRGDVCQRDEPASC